MKEKKRKRFTIRYSNNTYLEKKPQTGLGALSKILASLLANVGDVIGI